VRKKLIKKNSEPFGKKCQKTSEGGVFFDSHCSSNAKQIHTVSGKKETTVF